MAKTFHACAFAAIRNAFPQRELTTSGGKSHRDWAPIARIVGTSNPKDISAVVGVTDYARESGVGLSCGMPNSEQTWEKLLMEQCMRTPQKFDQLVKTLPSIFHDSQWVQDTDIRFGDMIYWCVGHDLVLRTYKHVLVDEAQDLSPPQIEFLKRLLPVNGRIVAFGDSHQSIYAFRGSSLFALDELQETFSAHTLPLSVSYRCPQLVTKEAQVHAPEMLAHPDNIEGNVEWIEEDLFPENVECEIGQETAILCRNNAPLMRAALRFLAAGYAVQIRSNLKGTLSRLFQYELRCDEPDIEMPQVESNLEKFLETERKEAEDRNAWGRLDYLSDLEETVRAFLLTLDAPSGWRRLLDTLFDNPQGMVFSTIHRAKGMEWNTVIFYEPSLIPSTRAVSAEALQQEDNLAFVIKTRAKKELIYWQESSE